MENSLMDSSNLERTLDKMRRDWDERARENARFYVNTERTDWTDDDFFASGERTVAEEILTDMTNICQGKDPKQMRPSRVKPSMLSRLSLAAASLLSPISESPPPPTKRHLPRSPAAIPSMKMAASHSTRILN